MSGTRHRTSRGYAVSVAVVVAVIAVLTAVGCLNLADTHWLTGTVALLIAAGFTSALVVIRALTRLNRALIHQNALLLYDAKYPAADLSDEASHGA